MAIHEKSLIEPDHLLTEDKLVIDGVDVSGQWNTFIQPRYISDYDDGFEDTIRSLPGGEYVYRCWQCGSCTNACTVYALNTDFNPRYWIYAVRLGLKDEIIKDKDIIWQCVSCHKCTNICPKDVRPEGVMKALAIWLEEKGYTSKSPSQVFDEEFWDEVYQTGRIEDTRVVVNFLRKTGQSLFQNWLVAFGMRMMKHLPFRHALRMAGNLVFKPKTRGWGRTGEVLAAYVKEQRGKIHG